MMKVTLASVGNPDFGQVSGRSLPGVPRKTVSVADLAEASSVCRAYIVEYDLGGGNWAGGKITEGGTVVGRVSYNGRVWPAGEWTPDTKPLL